MEVHHGKYGAKLPLRPHQTVSNHAKHNAEVRPYTPSTHEPAMRTEYNLKQASYTTWYNK